MPELAYVNGAFGPIGEARVSIEDRGFQFGDGVYEVIVAYDGRLFLLDRHMQRLRRSAAGIGLDYDFDRDPLEPVIRQGLERSGLRDAMVYVQITRGAAPRNHVFPKDVTPTVVMTFKPLPAVPQDVRRRGATLMTVPDPRWTHCSIKAITLLPNVLARNEAIRRGFDDALFITDAREVRECTSSNIFMARSGVLAYPPLTDAVLHGVTLSFLVECARAIDLPTEERAIGLDSLLAADEVFLSGTTTEVLGVTSIDGRPIAGGHVGPLTQRLYQEFLRRVRPE